MPHSSCNCRICRERRELTAAAMTAPYGSEPTTERTKAEPEKRYAVQMGDGSVAGPGNSLSLHRTETTARAVARAKAEEHPGKKVLLLAVTEVETCLVTIQTKAVKSWE